MTLRARSASGTARYPRAFSGLASGSTRRWRRRRAAEEHRIGAAGVLPLFLLDPAMLWDAARALPEVSNAEQARIWGRLVRATAPDPAMGALAALVALTPAQLLGGALLATALGATGGGAVVYALLQRPTYAAILDESAEGPTVTFGQAPPSRSGYATIAAPLAVPALASARSSRDSDAGATSHATTDPSAAEREERVLIDSARNALRTDYPDEALDVLSRHARKFPQGVYQEERESLRRQARRTLAETNGSKSGEIR